MPVQTTPIIYRASEITIANVASAKATFPIPRNGGASWAVLRFGDITALTCTVAVSKDEEVTYQNVATIDGSGVTYAAGTTITTTDYMEIGLQCAGATHIKVTRVAGTGPVGMYLMEYPTEQAGAFLANPVTIFPNTGTPTETTPSVLNANSFTLLAANSVRHYLLIYNGTGANIMISLGSLVLTGIVPTATNIGEVLTPGQYYENPAHFCSTSAITVYQTSGATVNTIVVVQG